MPRGTQFGQVIDMFREEAGLATSRAQGVQQLGSIKAKLRRVYRRLHADFQWPHLLIERTVTLSAGQRYYSFPAELDFDNVQNTWVQEVDEDHWYPLHYGIDTAHYNTTNSYEGEREDFPSNWKIHENGTFEIWPVPESNGHTVRFFGKARAKPLVDESEVLDLDDDLVIMFAVGEELARQKSPDAELVLQQAQVHYSRLRANTQKTAPFKMSPSQDRYSRGPGIRIEYAERRD